MAKNKGLGRGLDAIFNDNSIEQSSEAATKIRISDIEPNREQPRKDFDPASLEQLASSIAANETIADFLKNAVAGREYWWSIGISQIISNVPAAIVLWPFTTDLKALIYGLDTAGLVFIIGSLASVINLRLYTREYPGRGKQFFLVFEKISLCFFAIVVLLQLLLL